MVWACLAPSAAGGEQEAPVPVQVGINRLKPEVVGSVDELIHGRMRRFPQIEFVIVGIVHDGKIVLTKSYGTEVDAKCAWASISKTATAMIVMQLVAEGAIQSLDDNVWQYDRAYRDGMPDAHRDAPLTLRHLLTHRAGLPHNEGAIHNRDSIWTEEGDRRVLRLRFRPGDEYHYSTQSSAVLGDVVRAVTGKAYHELVRERIGRPVGADSLGAREQDDSWSSPGAFVASTIEDMARYSIGIIENTYVASDVLFGEILRSSHATGDGSFQGLGWRFCGSGDDLVAHHTGCNGRPQAYLRIKPRKRASVSLFFRSKDSKTLGDERIALGREIMEAIERSGDPVDPMRAAVEADWTAQESRRGRSPADPGAIRDAFAAAAALRDYLQGSIGVAGAESSEAPAGETLDRLRRRAEAADSMSEPARRDLYVQIRSAGRSLALANPALASKPLVFLKRRRFISQMLHEYLGYYYDYGDIAGGGVYRLEEPGRSMKARDLVGDRLPRGNYTTLSLSYDAGTIYFAFAERAGAKPDYSSPRRRCFHVFAMDADGGNLRQLTDGPDDDFDPCPLPDGGVAFMSTRRGGFGRCHNPWEPLPAYTLHRMDASGENVRALSLHETNEWHPSVLADGRIVYIRWDYVDRSAANFHGLWVTGPGGSNPAVLFGNYTMRINACYQPRAIPGSNRVVFVAGAHHAAVGGSLVIVDPARVALDPETGHDRFDSLEVLTPEVCFPEASGWPSSYFHSPWPLSEACFLVAFSFDPLPGMGPRVGQDTPTGLYYFDRFGNLELLYREEGISSMYPIPLNARPVPPTMAGPTEPSLGDEGELVLTDVGRSLMPLPVSRPIRELRVYQVLPKTETHVANQPRIGYANAESARMLLGTVPVESDGSAYFRVPAGKPLYFQAVDGSGRAVQTMRSVTYVQPGERRGCVGCHEPVAAAPAVRRPLALDRAPSSIAPGPEGTRPFSYVRLVQPVLDRHCVRCHDGAAGPGKSRLALTGAPKDQFILSYENLKPYVRWYEWGGKTIRPIATMPGQSGADASPLATILDDDVHAETVRLPDDDRRRIHVWLDGNAPFYGTYAREARRAQLAGLDVPPPAVQ
jgi:CubicO group peptidase (beta-lactamase class C family)